MVRRVLLLLVVLAVAVAGLVTAVTAVTPPSDRPDAFVSGPVVEARVVRVLRAWDSRRADAFERGDPVALAALYVPGSRTGAADVRVLEGYRSRGLRVTAMTIQVLSADVVGEARDRIEVTVTDVLVDASVTDAHGESWALPHDQPSTRRVVLVLQGGRWLVAEVYPPD